MHPYKVQQVHRLALWASRAGWQIRRFVNAAGHPGYEGQDSAGRRFIASAHPDPRQALYLALLHALRMSSPV